MTGARAFSQGLIIEQHDGSPVASRRVELVERKGLGHPDSICDAIMEAISVRLCREYLERFGRVMHHNVDKGLLVAGVSEPRLHGGKVLEPIQLIFGDRAVQEHLGKRVPVAEIGEAVAKAWLRHNLRFLDPDEHVVYRNEIRPGSPELTDLFARERIGANDTSAAVGYAPLSETERLVLETERYLNSSTFKSRFPETGEDVKVMGCRVDRALTLTVAMAFVDRFVGAEHWYFERKREITADLERFLAHEARTLEPVRVNLNTLDSPGRAEGGMYLTVLGTSAEGGDSGEVGRGNRANGVIALMRPMGSEAAAGKNPVSHVGKIYSLFSHHLADELYRRVEGVREAYVWLVSQIGQPIEEPFLASLRLSLAPGVGLEDVRGPVEEIVTGELASLPKFTERLIHGELAVC